MMARQPIISYDWVSDTILGNSMDVLPSMMQYLVIQPKKTLYKIFNQLKFDISLISEEKVPSTKVSLTKEELGNIITKCSGHVVPEGDPQQPNTLVMCDSNTFRLDFKR